MSVIRKHERNSLPGTKVGYPVPDEHALCSHYNIFPLGSDKFKESFGIGVEVSVCLDLSDAVEYAHIHFLPVQIDSTVIFVLLGAIRKSMAVVAHGLSAALEGRGEWLLIEISCQCSPE